MSQEKHADLKTTPLTAWHEARGGRMVPFAGFAMPVQYEGVIAEHEAVRERVGLFDITHMGEIRVDGPGAEAWLDSLTTNRVVGGEVGKVVYTAMCNEVGGVLDDMLVYHLADERWLVVCNAANHDKIAAWLLSRAEGVAGLAVRDVSDATALIAVQGPDAPELMARVAAFAGRVEAVAALDFYTCLVAGPAGNDDAWIVSRTGYTGERGYEIYLPNADALPLWEELMTVGADLGVAPIGLAARDTLRFELAYCLYGHELGEDITPLEAGIGWAIRFKNRDFIGRDALLAQKKEGVPRRLVGLRLDGRGIAREQCPVFAGDRPVGAVTSGTFCPTLKEARALALIAADAADAELSIEIRGKRVPARPVPYPFVAARVKGDPRADRSITTP